MTPNKIDIYKVNSLGRDVAIRLDKKKFNRSEIALFLGMMHTLCDSR